MHLKGTRRVRRIGFDIGSVNLAVSCVDLIAHAPEHYDPEASTLVPPWFQIQMMGKCNLTDDKPAVAGKAGRTRKGNQFELCVSEDLREENRRVLELRAKMEGPRPAAVIDDQEGPPQFYPRAKFIGDVAGTALSKYQKWTHRLKNMLLTDEMAWMFSQPWPVVIENQVDELGHSIETQNHRLPENWLLSYILQALILGIDSARGFTTVRPISLVAKKYGIDVAQEFWRVNPESKTAPQSTSGSYLTRKNASIYVAKHLCQRTEQRRFLQFIDELDKRDDVCDAMLMALQAAIGDTRPTPLTTKEMQQMKDTLASEEKQMQVVDHTDDVVMSDDEMTVLDKVEWMRARFRKKKRKRSTAFAPSAPSATVTSREALVLDLTGDDRSTKKKKNKKKTSSSDDDDDDWTRSESRGRRYAIEYKSSHGGHRSSNNKTSARAPSPTFDFREHWN